MCTPGLTAPLAARVKSPFSVRRTGKKSTDDVSAAFVVCSVTLPQPVSSPFLNRGRFVFGDVLTGPPSLAEISPPLYCIYIQYKEVNLMPRRYEIDAAWRAAITREQDGRQTVTTAAFVRELHKFNWHWTPRQANQWIETYVTVFRDVSPNEGENRTFQLFNPNGGR